MKSMSKTLEHDHPIVVSAADVALRAKPSVYPQPFASMMQGREKRQLGEVFGIQNFGVNLTTLEPGAHSALLHKHSKQEEFIYILEGSPTLVTDQGEFLLHPGMCAGFTANGIAHQLINRTQNNVIYLEVGDRNKGDTVDYPVDDLVATFGKDGQWHFTHKNGEAYPT
jgi:uncharacterized cupin superfamily protein